MSRKARIRFAEMLIAFSFLIILVGFYSSKSYRILDPIKDVNIVSEGKKNSISITTTDDGGVSLENGGNPNFIPDNYPNLREGDTATTNLSEVNNRLRNFIQEKYGVFIRYGSETEGYSVGGLNTVAMVDEVAIQSSLTSMINVLELYPENFFSEMNAGGFSLNIYLVQRYSSGNVTGVTDHSARNVIISLATDFSLADSFNHEVFHYIDYYIEDKGGKYNSWNSFNPSGFEYGNVVSDYSYNRTFSEDAFFVNNYAQTDQFEDRASTFEYMMAPTKASCLNYGRSVWLKAKYMAEQVDYFYKSVSPRVTEYWERFIY